MLFPSLPFPGIQNNGDSIEWKHVVDLYMRANNPLKDSPGLTIVPKLKYEHISLTSFSKMCVDLAAQVYIIYNCV